MSPIVVGYDGTRGARAALAEATELAGPLGAELVVAFGFRVAATGGGEDADLQEVLRARGAQLEQDVLTGSRSAEVPVRFQLLDDRAAEGLAALATQLAARMIVVGSYGETPLRGAILGSTPHRLLHLADRPVLVVRTDGAR